MMKTHDENYSQDNELTIANPWIGETNLKP